MSVAGEFDAAFSASGSAIIALLAEQRRPVHVDLSGVTIFRAAGVNWLASLYAGIAAEVRVTAASDAAFEVLSACGVPLRSTGDLLESVRDSASTS